MSAALDAARKTKAEIAGRGEVRFECRRGVHGDVIVYVELGVKRQPEAWCCGVSMRRVKP